MCFRSWIWVFVEIRIAGDRRVNRRSLDAPSFILCKCTWACQHPIGWLDVLPGWRERPSMLCSKCSYAMDRGGRQRHVRNTENAAKADSGLVSSCRKRRRAGIWFSSVHVHWTKKLCRITRLWRLPWPGSSFITNATLMTKMNRRE